VVHVTLRRKARRYGGEFLEKLTGTKPAWATATEEAAKDLGKSAAPAGMSFVGKVRKALAGGAEDVIEKPIQNADILANFAEKYGPKVEGAAPRNWMGQADKTSKM